MKKHFPLICIVALLAITTLSNCNKDNDSNSDNSPAGGIAGLYRNATYMYDITVTKVDNNTVSISIDNYLGFNTTTMNSATTFTLNKVNQEDSDNRYEYTGNGSCSNGNISVTVETKVTDKQSGDVNTSTEFYTGSKVN
jgi:hypothetical protein